MSNLIKDRMAKLNLKDKKKLIDSQADIDNLLEVEKEPVCALVIVETTGKHGERMISREQVPQDSKARKYKGEYYHLLGLNKDGFRAIEPLVGEERDDELPTSCYGALFWDELDEIIMLVNSLTEKIKLGVFIALCFGLLIILFLISMTAVGGSPVG